MSRSEKKNPIICYGKNPGSKRQSNKKVRKSDIGNGNNYRKVFCSYDICDASSNLYRHHNGIWKYTNGIKMTIEEINKFWRK
jgi:hypothetical protein